jgi:hypothetical protein
MELTSQELSDRALVSETVTRYFTSLDHRDWMGMRATLADTLDLDFSELFGDPRATHDSDEFVEFARTVLSGFRASQHISPNHVIDLDGDRATCRAYMYAWHTVPTDPGVEDTFTLRGHYVCGLVRAPDGWRMDKLHMGVWDEAGNKGIYAIARERFDAAKASGTT